MKKRKQGQQKTTWKVQASYEWDTPPSRDLDVFREKRIKKNGEEREREDVRLMEKGANTETAEAQMDQDRNKRIMHVRPP